MTNEKLVIGFSAGIFTTPLELSLPSVCTISVNSFHADLGYFACTSTVIRDGVFKAISNFDSTMGTRVSAIFFHCSAQSWLLVTLVVWALWSRWLSGIGFAWAVPVESATASTTWENLFIVYFIRSVCHRTLWVWRWSRIRWAISPPIRGSATCVYGGHRRGRWYFHSWSRACTP